MPIIWLLEEKVLQTYQKETYEDLHLHSIEDISKVIYLRLLADQIHSDRHLVIPNGVYHKLMSFVPSPSVTFSLLVIGLSISSLRPSNNINVSRSNQVK